MEHQTLYAPDEVVSRGIERVLDRNGAIERIALSGSPSVALPPHIVEAAQAAVNEPGYAPSTGDPDLRESIAASLQAEGVAARPDAVLITNGAMQALDLSFRTLLKRGDRVLIPLPGFFIGGLVERAGAELLGFPSPEESGFQPDWDAAAESLPDARVKILFLNTPVNPTGYVFTRNDLERALELAARHDLWIVSDESYSHFVYRGEHRTIAALPGALERTILIRSFSKDFAMPGWRIGYMILPPRLAAQIGRTFEWSCLCVNRVSQAGAYAATTGPREWIDAFVTEAGTRGRWVAREIAAIEGLHCIPPKGGLNLFVRSDTDAEALVRRLVLGHGVPVHPGQSFGASEYFRVQFGAKDDVMKQAIMHIREVVNAL